ncbi:hypothetical protein DP44_5596 [Burkholderia pseudomallei]|nr:hypothetical protein DP44_5596 [Burkholderia pseudomallei]
MKIIPSTMEIIETIFSFISIVTYDNFRSIYLYLYY